MKRFSKMTAQEAAFRLQWGTATERLAAARREAQQYAQRDKIHVQAACEWRWHIKKPFNYAYYGKGGGTWSCHFPEETTAANQMEHQRIYRLPRGSEERVRFEVSGREAEFYVGGFDGFRVVGDCHDVVKKAGRPRLIDHTGWYCDSFCDERCIGVVLQLPYRAIVKLTLAHYHKFPTTTDLFQRLANLRVSKPKDRYDDPSGCYMAAIRYTDRDGVTIFPGAWFSDPVLAAQAADKHAERDAEENREADAKSLAEHDIEEAKGRIKDAREAMRAVLKELREARGAGLNYPALCGALQQSLQGWRHEMRAAWKLIAEREENYWSAIERH